MDTDTKDRVLTLYCEDELSEYAARVLLDDETIDHYNEKLTEAGRMSGHHRGSEGMSEWPADIPMPYGHLPKEEYYVEGHERR